MSVQKAIELLETIDKQPEIRMNLYHCSDSMELNNSLKAMGYDFNLEEYEAAVRTLHANCQNYEDAAHLMNKAELLRYLLINTKTEEL
jgi:hypothetical protein